MMILVMPSQVKSSQVKSSHDYFYYVECEDGTSAILFVNDVSCKFINIVVMPLGYVDTGATDLRS